MNSLSIKKPKPFALLERLFLSAPFMAVCVLLACVITSFQLEVAGVIVFVFLISLILVVCEDVIAALLPFLLISMFPIKCYGSFDIFIKLWWLAIPAVASFVVHLIIYKKPLVRGRAFWGLLAMAAAVTLGGAGMLTPGEYFNLTSIYYVGGLGFGMLAAYLIIGSMMPCKRDYSFTHRFAGIMTAAALFACFMVLEHYAVSYTLLRGNLHLLAFQWRNNISTYLMFFMPFVFYFATKKYSFLPLGFLCYGCMLLSGSRGGAVFGGAEFVMCLAAVIYLAKKRRAIYIASCAVMIVVVLMFSKELLVFFKSLLDRLVISDAEVRVGLFGRAIEDFKANPLFGRGLCYFGNTDIHSPPEFSLCWYHSLPFQLIGSFGIVGVLAYAYLTFTRCFVFLRCRTRFTVMMFISFLGIEMMSLVNPGEFCPIPYALLIVLFLVAAETVYGFYQKQEQ